MLRALDAESRHFVAAAVALGFCWASHPREARAEEPYSLEYAAPEGCPTSSEFRADVAARARDPERAAGARIDVTIAPSGSRFTGKLVVVDSVGHTGQREISGASCPALSSALAFLAALAIDLGGHMSEPTGEAPPSPTPPSSPPTPPRAASPPAPPPALAVPSPAPSAKALDAQHGSPLRWAASAALGIRGDLGPGVRPLGGIRLDAEDSRSALFAPLARLSAGASYSTISRAEGNAELLLFSGRLAGCPLRFSIGDFGLRPCVALESGAVLARGAGIDDARSHTSFWLSMQVFLNLRWQARSNLFFDLDAGPTLSLIRTQYFFEPNVDVYRLPVLAAYATLGAGFVF